MIVPFKISALMLSCIAWIKIYFTCPKEKGERLNANFPRGGDKPSVKDSNFEGAPWEPSKIPVNKKESTRARKIKAATPEEKENIFEEIERKGDVITPAKVLKGINKINLEKKKQEYQDKVEKVKSVESNMKIDIFNTSEKFRIIYADPPWKYNDTQNNSSLGGAEKHYSTMSVDDLCKLPLSTITETDAVLFLWITSPQLNNFLQIMTAWGFDYKTSFIWDKIKHNMGHYNSVRHEFLLIGGKGSSAPDVKQLFDSVQSIERTGKHSEKPVEFMNIIDTLYTHGDRIELFCREPKKDNWFYWGNEV